MSLRPATPLYPYRGHVLETAPATEPVDADALRTHLRATSAELGDTEADELVEEARAFIEETTGLALINQTWRLSLDNWPLGRGEWWDGVRQGAISELYGQSVSLCLPRYPLSSVTSVTTYDEAGNSTAVTVSNVFDVDTYQRPGRLNLKGGQTWPTATRPTNAIQVLYVAGYGANATDVPAPLVRAVKLVAAYMWEHRGDGCSAGDAYAASGAAAILDRYRAARL